MERCCKSQQQLGHPEFKHKRNKKWSRESRDLDVKNRTRLGTLGYLPLEVRQQIWGIVLNVCIPPLEYPYSNIKPQYPPNEMFQPEVSFGQGKATDVFQLLDKAEPYGMWPTLCPRPLASRYLLDDLQRSSLTIRTEVAAVFLSTHTFSFWDPFSLRCFCKAIPFKLRERLCHATIWFGRRTRRSLWEENEGEDLNDCLTNLRDKIMEWRDAANWLPSTVRTVKFRISDEIAHEKLEWRVLEQIARTVVEIAPEASMRVCLDGRKGQLGDGSWFAHTAIMENDTELSGDADGNGDGAYGFGGDIGAQSVAMKLSKLNLML